MPLFFNALFPPFLLKSSLDIDEGSTLDVDGCRKMDLSVEDAPASRAEDAPKRTIQDQDQDQDQVEGS